MTRTISVSMWKIIKQLMVLNVVWPVIRIHSFMAKLFCSRCCHFFSKLDSCRCNKCKTVNEQLDDSKVERKITQNTIVHEQQVVFLSQFNNTSVENIGRG